MMAMTTIEGRGGEGGYGKRAIGSKGEKVR